MIAKRIAALTPYVAGEQPAGGYIKLNTNENPYPPSPSVAEALRVFDTEKLRLYPDPDSKALTAEIAAYEGVRAENIFLGNGSDEVLAFGFCALFEKQVAFADVTYSFYPVYCDLYGFKKIILPLNPDFTVDSSAYKKTACGGIVIANPNAPVSLSMDEQEIIQLAKSVSCNVLIDEAYIDFARNTKSLASVAPQFKNLLIVKTFSKSYSLAGLRCGYAVGNAELIEGLNRVKNCFNSYTLGALCQTAALAAVRDRAYFNQTVQKILSTRQHTADALQKAGHTVITSDANFLFVRHSSVSGAEAYARLKQQNILVRHFAAPRTAAYIRVTVGTDAEMDAFTNAFLKF
ncbi:MAG: histidinol-phosphate transaminase [Firmicutes bacterium]|nr:histidinol-phosphate transaminase [Bacillota bacterium]